MRGSLIRLAAALILQALRSIPRPRREAIRAELLVGPVKRSGPRRYFLNPPAATTAPGFQQETQHMAQRTLTQGHNFELHFIPRKANGEPGQVDGIPVWEVQVGETTITLEPGEQAVGDLTLWGMSANGLLVTVFANPAAADNGGVETFQLTVTGDADLDVGEVRNVVAHLSLEVTLLPEEAVAADLDVGDVQPNPPTE